MKYLPLNTIIATHKICAFFVTSALLSIPMQVLSQTPRIVQANLKTTLTKGPLHWYFAKVNNPVSSGSTAQIHFKQRGGLSSFVGVNLPRTQQTLTPVGNTNFNINASGYCEVQNFKMDYLNEHAFNMVTTRQVFSGAIFPGAFIDAKSLLEASPVLYQGATNRAALKVGISISNPKSNAPTEVTLNDFGTNNINQLNTALRDKHFGAAIPAQFAFELKEIKSIDHLTATFNYSAGLMLPLEEFGLPVDLSQGINAKANNNTTKKIRNYMVSFIQPMYAYSVQEVDVNKFFTSSGLASGHTNAGYVSSVIFGRMALLTFQSVEDSASIDALLRGRLGITVTGGQLADAQLGVNINANVKTNFSNKISSFKAFIYGGNAATALQITSNPDAIFSFIRETNAAILGHPTGALPLQFTIQRVSDGRTIGVRSTSSFMAEDCLNPRYDIKVRVTEIRCHKVVEAPFDDAEDIFGNCKIGNISLFNIAEADKVSIKKDGKADINGEKKIVRESLTINNIKDLRLTFIPDIKDYELLIKPQYKAKQPGDLVFSFENKITQLYKLEPGQSVFIDGAPPKALRLYENGDTNSSSISIMYQIEVTRK